MASWDDSDSDDNQPIGARIHQDDKTLLPESTFRFIVLFLTLMIGVAATLAFVFSLLAWLELKGEINITSQVIDNLVTLSAFLPGHATATA